MGKQRGEISTILTMVAIVVTAVGVALGSWRVTQGPLKQRSKAADNSDKCVAPNVCRIVSDCPIYANLGVKDCISNPGIGSTTCCAPITPTWMPCVAPNQCVPVYDDDNKPCPDGNSPVLYSSGIYYRCPQPACAPAVGSGCPYVQCCSPVSSTPPPSPIDLSVSSANAPQGHALTITVTNRSSATIGTSDFKSSCSIFFIKKKTGAKWRKTNLPCPLGRPTMNVSIVPSESKSLNINGGSHSFLDPLLDPGEYRAEFIYKAVRNTADFWKDLSDNTIHWYTVYSPAFTVTGSAINPTLPQTPISLSPSPSVTPIPCSLPNRCLPGIPTTEKCFNGGSIIPEGEEACNPPGVMRPQPFYCCTPGPTNTVPSPTEPSYKVITPTPTKEPIPCVFPNSCKNRLNPNNPDECYDGGKIIPDGSDYCNPPGFARPEQFCCAPSPASTAPPLISPTFVPSPSEISPTSTPMPERCTAGYDPVCGADGKTYSNACRARQADVEVVVKGVCPAPTLLTAQATTCLGDVNGDNVVNGADIFFLLREWGRDCVEQACQGDINSDGRINALDLSIQIVNWGKRCP